MVSKFRQSFPTSAGAVRYMLIFAHAPLFLMSKKSIFVNPKIAGVDAVTWMRLAFCIGADCCSLLPTWNINLYSKLLAGSCAFFSRSGFIQSGVPACAVACLFTFSMAELPPWLFSPYLCLNSTERFFGAALRHSIMSSFSSFWPRKLRPLISRLYIAGLVFVTALCIFGYRKAISTCRGTATARKQIGLMLYFFCLPYRRNVLHLHPRRFWRQHCY